MNNTTYHDLSIRSVKPETSKAVTVTFDVPEALRQDFKVVPGQYLKLKADINGEAVERFYSICDFGDDYVQVGIKRVEDGVFSNYACDQLSTGDVLAVQAPQGDFCLPNHEAIAQTKRYCFIAAGSGITPNLAMMRYLLENYDDIEVDLVYVNGKRVDIMFFDEIEGLKNTHMGRFSVTHVVTREPSAIGILSKRPDADTSGKIIDNFIVAEGLDHVYLCGPLPLIDVFRNAFIERGIDKKAIHMELFGTPEVPKPKAPATPKVPELPFHTLAVTDVAPQTDNAKAITFAVPEDLRKDFQPTAGQYIKLRANINGEPVERFYSLCDFGDDFVQVGIKKVEGGVFSNYACDNIKAGDKLEVQLPQGDFCLPQPEQIAKENRYFFVAAGSGITPSLAMIKVLLDQHQNIDVNLLYINSKRADIMFFDELEALKNTHMGRLNVIHVLTREPRGIPMLSKRPDAESAGLIIDGLVGTDIDHTFMCGPLPLIELFRNALIERGIDKKAIHMELFGTPEAPARKTAQSADDSHTKDITVISQGVEQVIKIRDDQDVLDAALEGGITVPFACKGGVCATCKAKRLDGEAEMVLNYGLEDDDVERGMMLTCQTFVTSETATFDFDVQ
ncbi:MAG: hypothetical protein CR974_03945 [Gammaproteobacteria bacterium]|nr:MAG: hypothetical protein CR974_03945 [Gammaproteobacteria bacterium]